MAPRIQDFNWQNSCQDKKKKAKKKASMARQPAPHLVSCMCIIINYNSNLIIFAIPLLGASCYAAWLCMLCIACYIPKTLRFLSAVAGAEAAT